MAGWNPPGSPGSGQTYNFAGATWQWNGTQWINANTGQAFMPLHGVTDGSNAPAGQVGEVVTAVQNTGQAVASGAPTTVISVTLTAGDWDVWGTVGFATATTAPQSVEGGLNTAQVMPSGLAVNTSLASLFPGGGGPIAGCNLALAPCRITVTASTSVYLIAQQTSGAGVTASGQIIARRMR
jgi:hypothetical protein